MAALAAFTLTVSIHGCGREAIEAERLPNRIVARERSAHDFLTDDGSDSSDNSESGDGSDVSSGSDASHGDGTGSDRAPAANRSKKRRHRLPKTRRLAHVAHRLAGLSEAQYLKLQKRWVGTTTRACNFFLITALCESGYCRDSKPFYRAADFDLYFQKTGWRKVTLDELRARAGNREAMDVVFQKGGRFPGAPGHVMIYTGYDLELGLIRIAQGELRRISHERIEVPEEELNSWDGDYTIFARIAPRGK